MASAKTQPTPAWEKWKAIFSLRYLPLGAINVLEVCLVAGGIMAKVTGGHLMCKALKLEGVKSISALADDHILPILDVMAAQDFKIYDTRHKQAAVHMADGWSLLSAQFS